jgi:hypothetical protein
VLVFAGETALDAFALMKTVEVEVTLTDAV